MAGGELWLEISSDRVARITAFKLDSWSICGRRYKVGLSRRRRPRVIQWCRHARIRAVCEYGGFASLGKTHIIMIVSDAIAADSKGFATRCSSSIS